MDIFVTDIYLEFHTNHSSDNSKYSLSLYDPIKWKNDINAKDNLVVECKMLSNVILTLQRE